MGHTTEKMADPLSKDQQDALIVRRPTSLSFVEIVLGLAVALVAIIALSGVAPRTLTIVALIGASLCLLPHGIALAARWHGTVRSTLGGDQASLAGGALAQLVAGGVGIFLALVALGRNDLQLIGIALVVLTTALFVAVPSHSLARLERPREPAYGRNLAGELLSLALAAIGFVLALYALMSRRSLALLDVTLLVIGIALVTVGVIARPITAPTLRHRHRPAQPGHAHP